MSEKYKCEYCGRLISEELCPFCGAINTVKTKDDSQDKTCSAESNVRQPQANPINPVDSNARRLKIVVLFLSVAIAITVIVTLLFPKDPATYGIVHSDPLIGKTDKNGFLLTQNGATSSDHVLNGEKNEIFVVTALGEEKKFSVPCTYNDLTEIVHILPINKFLDNSRSFHTSKDAVTTVNPYEQMWIYDSYNIHQFCIYNSSDQPISLDDCVCDSYSTCDTSKITSFLFHDTELITDVVGILDSFGEPTFQFLSENFYSLEYQTTCGRLVISYDRDINGNIGNKPFSLTIENCRESRPI
ncbi:MAG: hypothetical protein K6F44_05080 [Lachnospiraceae bacterium]|nr:hypothetical protein [Lachnospiraceae bacterium]